MGIPECAIGMVYGSELRDLVPAAAPRMIAGVYSPGDGFANPILVTRAFAAAARRRGAKIWTRTEVQGFRREKNRIEGVNSSRGPLASRWVINAAGAPCAIPKQSGNFLLVKLQRRVRAALTDFSQRCKNDAVAGG